MFYILVVDFVLIVFSFCVFSYLVELIGKRKSVLFFFKV